LGLELAYDRFWNETPLRGTLGISISLPLHRGQIAAREDEARAGAAEAEWTLRGLRDQVAFEASDAAARVRESWHELETLDTTVLPTSERAHAAARSRYETGQGDFQATLTVTQSLLRLRLDRERTLSEYLSARADLEYAAGRMPAGAKGE
jgi:outer membrane protein TolC